MNPRGHGYPTVGRSVHVSSTWWPGATPGSGVSRARHAAIRPAAELAEILSLQGSHQDPCCRFAELIQPSAFQIAALSGKLGCRPITHFEMLPPFYSASWPAKSSTRALSAMEAATMNMSLQLICVRRYLGFYGHWRYFRATDVTPVKASVRPRPAAHCSLHGWMAHAQQEFPRKPQSPRGSRPPVCLRRCPPSIV